MGRPKKSLISKRETLEIALRIADEEGVDAVSIRRLGRELDVQGISLYYHFKNKDEILSGICHLALSQVRTPKSADVDWPEWLFQNAKAYRKALLAHPNLVPILMKWHPMRIGLAERNASAGLLAVQGVPPNVVMPLLEGLEVLVLGSASYKSAVQNDEQSENWRADYPNLYHLSKIAGLSYDQVFEIVARATITAVVNALGENESLDLQPNRKKQKRDIDKPQRSRSKAL
jgi:TetR/AcrR family tetracycline transcriptional repressor